MKILLDARLYGLENTGIGRYLVHLVNELKAIDNNNKYVILLNRKYFNELNLPKNWKKVLANFKHYSVIEQIYLPSLINKSRPDMVHFPHFIVPVFWSGRFITTIHDMTMHKQGTKSTTLPLPIYLMKRIPYKFVFRKAVKDSIKIITPTVAIKKELVKYFEISNKKVNQIYEGINSAYFKAEDSRKIIKKYGLIGQYFVYTGNAYPHKNLERVIEAISVLNSKSDKNIKFAVAGSRNYFTRRLEVLMKKMNMQKNIKLLGYVPDNELASIYAKSLGFIYPSFSEGFGLQGLEAMAAGTLVLASDISVFKEVYGKNAIFFNPYDFTSILNSIDTVLNMRSSVREVRIKKSRKFIKRYSWTKMAKETLRTYEDSNRLR